MIIPDAARRQYFDNLIGGLAMYVVGPAPLRLLLQGFVVLVGFLILAGAVNTAIVGSNGVLNRVSEDGVLSDWFRVPHRKFGTTYRIINLVAVLQIATIFLSRGRVYILGEAYAFGVVWSFALKALAVLVLRFTRPGEREWRVPLNLRLGRIEIPLGLGLIMVALFGVAIINLLTKQVATVSGLLFTGVFFSLFTYSEQRIRRESGGTQEHLDQFQVLAHEQLDGAGIRSGCAIVLVRDEHTLASVDYALAQIDADQQDVLVATVRTLRGPSGTERFYQEEIFTRHEQELFTKVVAVAERQGKHVGLLVVPSVDVFYGIARTAFQLQAADLLLGTSHVFTAEEQARRFGAAWDRVRGKRPRCIRLRIVGSNDLVSTFDIGPHLPALSSDDLAIIHRLWLAASREPAAREIHHRDIVMAGVRLLERELSGSEHTAAMEMIKDQAHQAASEPGTASQDQRK